jgi:hypothetical protein
MRLYYAWRFRAIRLNAQAEKAKLPTPREQRIAQQEKLFASDRATLDKELKQARGDLYNAQNRAELARVFMDDAQMKEQRYGTPIDPGLVQRQEAARRDVEQKQVAYDRVRARVSTAANDSELPAAMDKYGRMLLEDAKQIVEWQREDPKLKLRPHYSALIEAYLDEFERGRGLSETADAKVIELFDHYVHDSLAGFNTDETWPSDPRIVYVGGDNKLRYAFRPIDEVASGATKAA